MMSLHVSIFAIRTTVCAMPADSGWNRTARSSRIVLQEQSGASTNMERDSMRCSSFSLCLQIGLCFLAAASQLYAQQESVETTADQIAELSGVRGGVIVHCGCGDARLTTALGRDASCIVQGLSRDAEQVKKSREWLRSQQPSGNVTVQCWQEDFLPYADNLVNLFIAEESAMPPMSEVMRVLAPLGVVCIRGPDGWQKTVKPWPGEIDEWTHWLHAADGNPVAQDERVAPPRAIQWIASPRWSKSHDTGPSLTGMVTAQGRLFYIADTGPAGICDPEHHFETWHLCARDAFNGAMLWKRPLEDWGNRAWSPGRFPEGTHRWSGSAHGGIGPWTSNPRVIHKRLVAHGDHIYVTLGFRAPVSQLDAATGRIVRTYDGTAFTSEIVLHDNILFLTVDRAAQRAGKHGDQPAKSVAAIDPDSGRVLWQREGFHGVVDGKYRLMDGTLTRLSLTAGADKMFVRDRDAIVALDARTGAECWRSASEAIAPLKRQRQGIYWAADPVGDLLYSDGVVYSWQVKSHRQFPYPIELLALSSTDGSRLWQKDCGVGGFWSMVSAYKARGLVWTLASPQAPGWRQDSYQLWGLHPRSGDVVKTYDIDPIMKTIHHHRCYRNKATENYIVFSRNGLEFTDLNTGELNINRWVRGICAYGIMPANGFIYAPPQQCICFSSARVPGFIAYGGVCPQDAQRLVLDDSRLLQGPAYGAMITAPKLDDTDWRMYRHDGLRSASTSVELPSTLSPAWERDLKEPITAPTTGWEKVFLAGMRTRRVMALDSQSGETAWAVDVDDRVDTPPTLWQGKVYFGTTGGHVYCLRANDGELVWRFNANPAYKSIVVHGNIESAWPVHGSVLVSQGLVYFAAGRSSYVDGGLRFYALDAATGQQRLFARQDTADIECQQAGAESRGTHNDLFVQDGPSLYLKNLRVNPKTLRIEAATWPYTPWTKEPWEQDFKGSPFVSITGFLDDSLYDRSSYILNQRDSARMLVFNEDLLVGVRWAANNAVSGRLLYHEGLFEIGRNKYTVFARKRSQVGRPAAKSPRDQWTRDVDIRIGAMALAGNTLVAAGTPLSPDGTPSPEFALRALRGEEGGTLIRLNMSDGTPSEVSKLLSPPVWDGIAVNRHGVFLALRDGKVVKLADDN